MTAQSIEALSLPSLGVTKTNHCDINADDAIVISISAEKVQKNAKLVLSVQCMKQKMHKLQ